MATGDGLTLPFFGLSYGRTQLPTQRYPPHASAEVRARKTPTRPGVRRKEMR